MHDLWTDLRIAMRRLRRSPGFALMAVVSLTMAIAASLVVFGVLRAAVRREMGIADGSRVVMVVQKPEGYINQSYPDYIDYRDRNTTLSGLAAYRISEAGVSVQGSARKVWDYEVSGNYFDTLGVQPELGRFFHASDEHGANSAPWVVLSDGFWRAHFGADPNVVGMRVEVDKQPFTVIGVAPPNFHGTELFLWPDLWVPMVDAAEIDGYSYLDKRYSHGLFVVGRLKPLVSEKQAADNLNAVAAQLAKQYPQTDDQMGARLVRPGLFGDQIQDTSRNFLAGLLALALLTLLAACANLASIFAARSADRSRELAIRLAIGSTRWRMLRQVLAEAVLLSVGGGAVGTFAAAWLLRLLSVWRPIANLPIRVTVDADVGVYALAVLLAVASGILPALLTARQIWQVEAMTVMKGSAQGVLKKMTMRDVLLGVQVALCALLVTCALVGLRGMERQLSAPIGFHPEGAMLAETEMKMAGYSDSSALPVEKRMIEEAEQVPGVTAAATIDEEPLGSGGSSTPVYREGTMDFRSSNSPMVARFFTISPGYVKTAETRLIAGRDFTWHDDAHAPKVAIVNEAFAHQLFGNGSAVGRHFAMPGPTDYEVVGVVENGKYESMAEEQKPAMFWALAQNNENEATLVVRSRRAPAEMAAALSAMMRRIDPSLPVTIESWPAAMALVLFPARVATVALGVLGMLAGMLAATGIFGMASYAVARRLREMGIRVALGAQRMQVLRAALGRTVLLLTLGSLAGLVLGVAATRVLASIVYQATVYDPMVIVGAVLAMIAIGTLAAAVPARRAVGVDPAVLLREE